MKRVFIAGPYSADNIISVLDNIRDGLRISAEVLLAGHAPFSPWTDFLLHFMLRRHESFSVENYRNMSLTWLRQAEVVLMAPRWSESKGALAEKIEAERLGIPVVYRVEDIVGEP